jgi:hypothetical protein
MARQMGFDFGLENKETCFKRKFRWLLTIEGISADQNSVNSLPPLKSARPNISFKEMEVKHLIENVYYPARPDWKPITLVLYDLKRDEHPVFEWIRTIYDASGNGTWLPSGENEFKKEARLELFDGCGNVIETWKYENAWPQTVDFGEMDMGDSSYMTADVTLRYDRAFID